MTSRGDLPDLLQQAGGLSEGTAREISKQTGVPEADVYGVASFFHLLARPSQKVRVCTGLSCRLGGADAVLEACESAGLPVEGVSCLAGCDVPPAVLRDRRVLPHVTVSDVEEAKGEWRRLSSEKGERAWRGFVGPDIDDPETLALNLCGQPDWSGTAFERAQVLGPDGVIAAIEASGLQGRGGAGFPAHIKWKPACASRSETTRYVVLNADEGEPGTFKDREVMLRRPDLVVEGLAIAAHAVGARGGLRSTCVASSRCRGA